jgi:hypothetical protein
MGSSNIGLVHKDGLWYYSDNIIIVFVSMHPLHMTDVIFIIDNFWS